MHLFILWGMLVLAFGTLMVLLKADLGLPVFQGDFYLWLSLALDALGLAAVIGVVMAMVRRYLIRPSRLDNRPDDLLILGGLLVVLVVGFVLEGIRMAAVPDEWEYWSPVGWALSGLFSGMSPDSLEITYQVLWWFHLLTACVLIAIIPFTKLLHIATAPANQMSAADRTRKGRIPAIDFNDETKELYRARRRGGTRQTGAPGARGVHALRAMPGCVSGVRVGQGAHAEAGGPRPAALARGRTAELAAGDPPEGRRAGGPR